MQDYEYLFSMTLQQKLKSKIIGKIYVKVTQNDELLTIIRREDDDEDMEFKLFLGHFSERLINGWTTEYAAYEVMRAYKDFITKRMSERYFYQD